MLVSIDIIKLITNLIFVILLSLFILRLCFKTGNLFGAQLNLRYVYKFT